MAYPLIVIVGMPGAGKSVVSEYLVDLGLRYFRFGQVTIDELERRGLPINEANERNIREELRQTLGMEAYARLLWPRIQQQAEEGPCALDGLYSWSEYRFLRSQTTNLHVVAVVAGRMLRYERLNRRKIRPLTPEEAEQRDFAEIENLEKGGPIAIADYTLLNNTSVEDLYRQLADALSHMHLTTTA